MGVKVRERNGAWWVFIDHKGRRKAKRCASKKAAQLAADKIDATLSLGQLDVFTPDRASPTVPTFKQYAEQWLTETIAPHRKPRTEHYYRTVLERHVWPALGAVPITDIKPAQIRALIAQKLQAGAARNTVKNIAATVRAI